MFYSRAEEDARFYDATPYAGYLPTMYMEANLLDGHDRGCGYGAGADCYCSKYTKAIEGAREEYRALRTTAQRMHRLNPGLGLRAQWDAMEVRTYAELYREGGWEPELDAVAGAYVLAAQALVQDAQEVVDELWSARADAAEGTY